MSNYKCVYSVKKKMYRMRYIYYTFIMSYRVVKYDALRIFIYVKFSIYMYILSFLSLDTPIWDARTLQPLCD